MLSSVVGSSVVYVWQSVVMRGSACFFTCGEYKRVFKGLDKVCVKTVLIKRSNYLREVWCGRRSLPDSILFLDYSEVYLDGADLSCFFG
jgi:hypothetical protein